MVSSGMRHIIDWEGVRDVLVEFGASQFRVVKSKYS